LKKNYYILFFLLLIVQICVSQPNLKHQVYFETDEYDIPQTERSRLLLFLSQIDTLTIKKVSIYGFCDDRGSDSYNLVLSQQRADAIKAVFSSRNFEETLITNVDGKGEILLNIVHESDINKIRGLNRKVEIIVTPYVPEPVKTEEKSTNKKPSTEDLLQGDLKAGDKILLENLLFHSGYTYLTKDSRKVLDRIATILVDREDIYFTIEGHVCCTDGTRDAVDRKTKKRNLSVARARFIYNYLLKKGVERKRMKFVGHKHKFPLGEEPEKDRRVEILVTRVLTPITE